MTNSFLRVTFPKMDNLKCNNTGSWRCLEFQNCDFWQSARFVSWVNLPTNKFAMFFETRNCRAEDKYVFISKQGLQSGVNKFESFQPIRSMMIRQNHNYTRRPLSTQFKCPTRYESSSVEAAKVEHYTDASTTPSFENCSDDGSVIYTGSNLSSNWYDDFLTQPRRL
ncbi:hypothetical protein V7S43_007901 [Phytophthora oleae]|uniref:Uncharacterized protein n=1 Tax=Phytophthora oleae TaxID=2107226 RepID=A0ABD3FMZ4_9STRA